MSGDPPRFDSRWSGQVVSFVLRRGKDGAMTSEPDRPSAANAPLPGEPTPPPSAKMPEGAPAPHPTKSAPPPQNAVKFTKTAALWSALVPGFLILIVLLIFIAQNTESAQFAFLGWRWSLPLGVAILAAAVSGGLLTVAAGTARIMQLRRAAKKNLKAGL
jgi:uncharacterized integral membrane protein